VVIDVRDAETNTLVRRTIGSDTLSKNPHRNSNRITAMIERAFRDFSPR
jgi:hypothetical protein